MAPNYNWTGGLFAWNERGNANTPNVPTFPSLKHWIFILFCALPSGFVFAQPSEFQFHPLNDKDGLGQEFGNKLYRDKRGGLWVATYNGLVFFDGSHASYFKHGADTNSIINNGVLSVTEDANGNMWGGTENGVFCYDRQQRKFRNYHMPAVMERNAWEVICDTDGTVWANGWHGLARLRPGAKRFDTAVFYRGTPAGPELLQMNRNCLLNDPSGKGIWLATRKGLRYFHKSSGQLDDVWSKPGHPLFNNHRVSAMCRTSDQRFWFFDNDAKAAICFNPKTQSIIHRISLAESIPQANAFSIFESRDGKLWLGLVQNEILVLDIQSGKILARPQADPADPYAISGNALITAMQDEDGAVWLCTSAGICKWFGQRSLFQIHALSSRKDVFGPNAHIIHMEEDTTNGTWWLATSDFKAVQYNPANTAINVYDLAKLQPPGWKKERGTITYIRIFNGQVVICTYSGCYALQSNGRLVPFQPLPAGFEWFVPMEIVTSDNVNFYYSNGNNVVRYNKETKTGTLLPKLSKETVKASGAAFLTMAPDHSLWIVAGSGWIAGYNNNGMDSAYLIRDMTMEGHGYSSSMNVDGDGCIWLSNTGVGLHKYNPKTRQRHLYTTVDGLATNNIVVTQPDRYQNIWCGDRHQYSVLISKTGSFFNFSLPLYRRNATWYLKMMLLNNGHVAAGAYQDIVEFFPDRLMQQPTKKLPQISAAEINGEFRLLTHDSSIRLEPSENSILLRFGLLTDNEIFPYLFSWKLERYDKEWQPATERTEAIYNQLPPGEYVFKVKAIARNKIWETPEKTFIIIVGKRFYQTLWFRIVIVLLIMGLLYAVYRYRLHQQKQILSLETKAESLEKEKAMIQYESLKQHLNPHFLFNSLTSLRSLIKTDSKTAAWFLDGLSKVYRYVLKSADQELVLLQDEVAFVKTFTELQKVRFGEGLQVAINISPEAGQRHIAPVVLQNLVENAIKHNTTSVDSPLVIEIFSNHDRLIVRNNLQRYRVVETSNKQGLQSLKKLYGFYTDQPIVIEENESHFFISIPLL